MQEIGEQEKYVVLSLEQREIYIKIYSSGEENNGSFFARVNPRKKRKRSVNGFVFWKKNYRAHEFLRHALLGVKKT